VIVSARRSSKAKALGALPWLVVSLVFLARFHGVALVAVAALDVVVGLGTAGLLLRSARHTRLRFTGGRLLYRGIGREREVLADHRPGKIVQAQVKGPDGKLVNLWLLINADGVCEVNLNRDAFDPAALEHLAGVLQLREEHVDGGYTLVELRERYPSAVPWVAAHWLATTLMFVFGGVVVVLVIQSL